MQTQIKINEMKGTQFKKDLGLLRAIKSYQNKHKDQSGNFGFVLVIEKEKKNYIICEKRIKKWGDENAR